MEKIIFHFPSQSGHEIIDDLNNVRCIQMKYRFPKLIYLFFPEFYFPCHSDPH